MTRSAKEVHEAGGTPGDFRKTRGGARLGFCSVLVVAWFLATASINGQGDIPDGLSCPTCSIRIVARVQVGSESEAGILPGTPADVDVDSHGRYLVLVPREPLMAFDEQGNFVSEVGGFGDGPGEYRHPLLVTTGRDYIAVFEDSRAIVFDSDFQALRTVWFDHRRISEAAFFGGTGQVLVNGLLGDATSVRLPFSIVDLSSTPVTVVREFGPDLEDRTTRAGHYRLRHVLDAPNDDTIWVAERLRYHVSKWNTVGERLDSLRRAPGWFHGFSSGLPGGPKTAPEPTIVGISSDSVGRLWIFLRVAAPRWRETWAKWITKNGPLRDGEYPADVLPRIWELTATRVEILDPTTRRVVHSETLDGFVIGTLSDARVAIYTEAAPDYAPTLEILTLALSEEDD